MPWFSSERDDGDGWRLDIVALLAVTGESFIQEHAQAITASALCLIPRIMPAPQALMRPWRPASLPSEPAKVVGLYTGLVLESLGFFANMMHPLDLLPPFDFRVIGIKYREPKLGSIEVPRVLQPTARVKTAEASGNSTAATPSAHDIENNPVPGIRRRTTVQEKVTDFVSNAPSAPGRRRPTTPHALYSPLNILTMFSFLLTIGLLIMAGIWQDGTAVLAIILVSLAASSIGAGAWWRPMLMVRNTSDIDVSSRPGDIMIRTREGAFVLVRCSEAIARELYVGAEECRYRYSLPAYRGFMIAGAVFMMPAVILFGNCTFNMQLAVGVSYMGLNIAYWALGLLPRSMFWDMSRYQWTDITPADAMGASRSSDDWYKEHTLRVDVPSYTRTLWYAIRETKRIGWVARTGAAPQTPEYTQWLAEAEEAASKGHRDWQAVARKDEIIKAASDAADANPDLLFEQPPPPQQTIPPPGPDQRDAF